VFEVESHVADSHVFWCWVSAQQNYVVFKNRKFRCNHRVV